MILSQHRDPVDISLCQSRHLTRPLSREDHGYPEPPSPVLDYHLSPLIGLGKSSGDRPLDIEVHHISPVLGLPKRDEDVVPEAILILIQRHTWGALVVGQDVAVAPGVILIGDDVVLKELDLLSPLEDRHLTPRILEL